MGTEKVVCVYVGEGLKRYGFGHGHPFGPDRMDAFWNEARRQGLHERLRVLEPVRAEREAIERFHTAEYIDRVVAQSETGAGLLDYGDTPAFPGVYEAASFVVGTNLDACEHLMKGDCRRAFIPIAGLHHARRSSAGGFCVFNDPGVAMEMLRERYGLERIAYVDVDAHHGDGVFYSFEDDPHIYIADFHEDGRFLYPGTGHANETGRGDGANTKINIPMPPFAGDEQFMDEWPRVEEFLHAARPQFIFMQCGADSLAGDPITHLQYTTAAHAHAAARLCKIADEHAEGRLLAMGGGGYNRSNLAQAWTTVVKTLIESVH